jgi:hypothetical protein
MHPPPPRPPFPSAAAPRRAPRLRSAPRRPRARAPQDFLAAQRPQQRPPRLLSAAAPRPPSTRASRPTHPLRGSLAPLPHPPLPRPPSPSAAAQRLPPPSPLPRRPLALRPAHPLLVAASTRRPRRCLPEGSLAHRPPPPPPSAARRLPCPRLEAARPRRAPSAPPLRHRAPLAPPLRHRAPLAPPLRHRAPSAPPLRHRALLAPPLRRRRRGCLARRPLPLHRRLAPHLPRPLRPPLVAALRSSVRLPAPPRLPSVPLGRRRCQPSANLQPRQHPPQGSLARRPLPPPPLGSRLRVASAARRRRADLAPRRRQAASAARRLPCPRLGVVRPRRVPSAPRLRRREPLAPRLRHREPLVPPLRHRRRGCLAAVPLPRSVRPPPAEALAAARQRRRRLLHLAAVARPQRLAAHRPHLGPVALARQPSANRLQRLLQVRLPHLPSPHPHTRATSVSPAALLCYINALKSTLGYVTRQAASRWGSKTNRKGVARRAAPRTAACARGAEPPAWARDDSAGGPD